MVLESFQQHFRFFGQIGEGLNESEDAKEA